MEPKKLNFGSEDFTNEVSRKKKPSARSIIEDVKEVAENEGFTSRKSTPPKIDGRSLRKTNRNFQLNISVSAETRDEFWTFASRGNFSSGGDFLNALLKCFEKHGQQE